MQDRGGRVHHRRLPAINGVVFTDNFCPHNPLPTSDFQVIDIAGSGLDLKSRLPID
jgi:hypothetical protein